MKLFEKIALKAHKQVYGTRCEIHPGIKYFDETHFKGLIKDDFEFINSNGFKLKGGIYHYQNYDANTLIIFCHGMGGGHQAYTKEIEYIARSGYQVLAIDYQGTILSEGDKLGGFCQPLKDLDECLNQIENNYSKLYVVGHSWGGWISQGLTYLHPKISKVVMIAGINSLQYCFKQYIKPTLFYIRKPFLNIEKQLYPTLYNICATDSLNRKDLKGLVIHSIDDQMVWYKYNAKIIKEKNRNPNIEFIIVENKNHNPQYTIDAVNYLKSYLHKLNHVKTKEEINELLKTADFDKMSTLDPSIMDKVINFLKN